MADWSPTHGIVLGALVLLYVVSCVRVSFAMHRTGRSFALWLLVTLCTTAIPAMVVLWQDSLKRLGGAARPAGGGRGQADGPAEAEFVRCRHCGHLFSEAEARGAGGVRRCPNCDLPVDEGMLA
jgi:hypothetical protein